MILDYRVYCTLYAALLLAWYLTPMAGKRTEEAMGAVAFAAMLLVFLNYLDWLWS